MTPDAVVLDLGIQINDTLRTIAHCVSGDRLTQEVIL